MHTKKADKGLHGHTCKCRIALIAPCHGGQVDGRFYIRFGWDFIFCVILLELVNGHEIPIKYIVVKYPRGTSQNPF